MHIAVYGIKNCDTVRKTRKFLDRHGVDYEFHEFRDDGLEAAKLESWIDAVGLDTLLNKRSTSWRNLSDRQKKDASIEARSLLILAEPRLIKRPVIEAGNQVHVGHDERVLKRYI